MEKLWKTEFFDVSSKSQMWLLVILLISANNYLNRKQDREYKFLNQKNKSESISFMWSIALKKSYKM